MKKKVISLFVIAILFASFPMSVLAEEVTYGDYLDELAEAQEELRKNQALIDDKENQVDTNNSTIQSLKNSMQKMSEESVELQEEIVESNKEIEEKQEETKSLLAYLQMSQGENLYMEYVFGGDTITDFIYRYSVVEQITAYNDNAIKELNDLITKNENRKTELKNKQEEYEKKVASLNEEIKKLNVSIAEIEGLSPSLEEQVRDKKLLVDYYKKQGCTSRNQVIGRDCAVTSSNAVFLRPIKTGYVTSFIGYRWGSLHRGIDIGSSTGKNTALYSIGNGTITNIYHDNNGALCLVIQYRTTNGTYYSALYAHLSRYASNIYVGMQVNSNTIVGYMGDTGYAFGVHLHLEVWPCRLFSDSNCGKWDNYVSFVNRSYSSGFRGAESVINFPSKTYTTWYTR